MESSGSRTAKGGSAVTLTDEAGRCVTGSRRRPRFGCTVTVDAGGNMSPDGRAGRSLRRSTWARTSTQQPTGGSSTGLGGWGLKRCAACRQVYETNDRRGVNWTNREGSRFAPAMLASGVSRAFSPPKAYGREDRAGRKSGRSGSGWLPGDDRWARRWGRCRAPHRAGTIREDEGKTMAW